MQSILQDGSSVRGSMELICKAGKGVHSDTAVRLCGEELLTRQGYGWLTYGAAGV
jgi:hypothetical protein